MTEHDSPSKITRRLWPSCILPFTSRISRSVISAVDLSGSGRSAGKDPSCLYLLHSLRYFIISPPTRCFCRAIMAWGFESSNEGSFLKSTATGAGYTRADTARFSPSESVTSPQGRFQAVNESLCSSDNQAFRSATFQSAAPSGSSSFDHTLCPSG